MLDLFEQSEGDSMNEDRILDKIEELKTVLTEHITACKFHVDKVDKLEKTVNGNGKPGIMEQVTKKDNEINKEIKRIKYFIYAITVFLAAQFPEQAVKFTTLLKGLFL